MNHSQLLEQVDFGPDLPETLSVDDLLGEVHIRYLTVLERDGIGVRDSFLRWLKPQVSSKVDREQVIKEMAIAELRFHAGSARPSKKATDRNAYNREPI